MSIPRLNARFIVILTAALVLAVTGLVGVGVKSAPATMCMVDCWDDDGGWSGGGGLGGGDGGGDPDDGIGGGGGGDGVGDIPDNSPSGTGWGDGRLPTDKDALGACEDKCDQLLNYATDLCSVMHDSPRLKALCYASAMVTYGACLKACANYADLHGQVCRAKPSLPMCEP